MLFITKKYVVEVFRIFMNASLIMKLITLGIIAIYILIVFFVIKKSKPIEGVTKGKVWIINIVGYGLIGLSCGLMVGIIVVFFVTSIVSVIGGFLGFNPPSEALQCIIGLVIAIAIHLTFFIMSSNAFLTSPQNIGLEESMTPKKYIFLILKLIWYGFLVSWGLGLLFFYIIYKLLFGVSKVADTVQNTRDYLYSEQDDILLRKYETGDFKTKEELKEEEEKIIERRERKRKRKEGKFW